MSAKGTINTVGCAKRTHGMTGTTEWHIWNSMKARYGGKKRLEVS